MKAGLYCGSFNPWHVGHQDVLEKACKVFDKVVVLMCQNPEKAADSDIGDRSIELHRLIKEQGLNAEVDLWTGTIKSFLENRYHDPHPYEWTAFIRGLRNGMDLEYETAQMGLHEDTGMNLPFVCFLTDRKYGHVSSSAVRGLDKLGLKHGYTDFSKDKRDTQECHRSTGFV